MEGLCPYGGPAGREAGSPPPLCSLVLSICLAKSRVKHLHLLRILSASGAGNLGLPGPVCRDGETKAMRTKCPHVSLPANHGPSKLPVGDLLLFHLPWLEQERSRWGNSLRGQVESGWNGGRRPRCWVRKTLEVNGLRGTVRCRGLHRVLCSPETWQGRGQGALLGLPMVLRGSPGSQLPGEDEML